MKNVFLSNKKNFLVMLFILMLIVAFSMTTFRKQRLEVLSTNPSNNDTHNPFVPVIIQFNITPKSVDGLFTLYPETEVVTTILKNGSVQISPASNFLPETLYKIIINTNPQFVLSFTSEQTGSNSPGWNDAVNKEHERYLEKFGSQDKALMNIRAGAPIKKDGFIVNYSYANNTYTVALFQPYKENKMAFLAWLKDLGVNNIEIVRIKYVSN